MTNSPSKWRCPRHWTAEQRLARYTKVDPLSGCRIWQASTKPNGYGQLTYRMRRVMAHRLAWIARHGPIPKGLEVCHRCDERRCCNADHLFLGSHAENMADLRIKRDSIVTYKAEQKGTFMGQPLPPLVYVSTIWANHGGTWHAVFHQESTAAKH